MSKDEWRAALEKYAEAKGVRLNPDSKHVDFLLDGIFSIQAETGLKYCPCRLRMGDFSQTAALLCPCNFETQQTWLEQSRCWCGLFTKK